MESWHIGTKSFDKINPETNVARKDIRNVPKGKAKSISNKNQKKGDTQGMGNPTGISDALPQYQGYQDEYGWWHPLDCGCTN